jgi:hypothetical protein
MRMLILLCAMLAAVVAGQLGITVLLTRGVSSAGHIVGWLLLMVAIGCTRAAVERAQ